MKLAALKLIKMSLSILWFTALTLNATSSLAAPDLPIIAVTKIKAPVDDDGFWRRVNTKSANFQVMLETQLTRVGRFQVMERNRVDEVLGEQGLNNEFGDGQTAGGGFNVSGVDYLVYGSITKFGQKQKRMQTGSFSSASLITEFEADIKLVDASTGEVRKAETASVSLQTAGGVSTGGFTSVNAEADPLSDAQRIAAKKVAGIIATSIFPIEIIRGGATIYLNYGNAILDAGDKLTVFRPGEELIDEATGLNLGSEEEKIGEIEITESTDKFSKAVLLSGDGPSKGDLARVSSKGSERKGSTGKPGAKRGKKI